VVSFQRSVPSELPVLTISVEVGTMRTFWLLGIAALVFVPSLSLMVHGQDDDARERGLVVKFQSGTIDGMQVSVLKKSGAQKVPVEPDTPFKEGDEIWVSFASNFDGYVYIVNVMPDGQKRVLFPYQTGTDAQTSNVVRADQRYVLPKGDAFAFDEHPGTEILQVIMSRDPVPFLDAAVKNPNGDLGDTASSAAAELQGRASKQTQVGVKPSEVSNAQQSTGIVTEDVAIVVPPSDADSVRTRDIRRVTVARNSPTIARNSTSVKAPPAGRHRVDRKGTVVAIPDEPGKSGKLKPGDLAVFEIRLKHI